MATLPNVNVRFGGGGLGRPLTGSDHIAGLIFTNAAPSGFGSDSVKKFTTLQSAIDAGIVNDYSDETKATFTATVDDKGAAGNNVILKYQKYNGEIIEIANYTLTTANAVSLTTSAAALTLAINLGTASHGFTATSAVAVVTITAPKGEGIYPNASIPLSYIDTGVFSMTLTAGIVGVASKRIIEYYHVSEFFRLNPKGILYVGYYSTYAASNIGLIRDFANGEIKNIGVIHSGVAFAVNQVTDLQLQANDAFNNYRPLSILFAPEISGTADATTLINLTLQTAPNVSVTIGQDGNSFGYKLFKTTGKSISDLGAKLGALSIAKVSDSIAAVGKFNMSDGTELDSIALSNGQKNLSPNTLEAIHSYGWCFLRKFDGLTGTYNTPLMTATASDNDQHYLNLTNVLNKAYRNVRKALLVKLSSAVELKANGTLEDYEIEGFKSIISESMDQMVRDGEVSNYDKLIDSTQNVASTGKIYVTVKILPIGTADYIDVTIGLTNNISA